ncbi:MAG: hypothetical protein QE487_06790 [Fluviicola sp.]|nr:hypothetical protein [Fluviicola sp.]
MQNSLIDSPENNPTKAIADLLPIGAVVFMMLTILSKILMSLSDLLWFVIPANEYVLFVLTNVFCIATVALIARSITKNIWIQVNRGTLQTKSMVIRYSVLLAFLFFVQYLVHEFVNAAILAQMKGIQGFFFTKSFGNFMTYATPVFRFIEIAVLFFALTRKR